MDVTPYYQDRHATIYHGDARSLPLPDASVDLICTSPPYWALRSYTDGGEHYAGQIGAEPTPGEYVDSLIACTREWMRVLKPSGSIWINLGDKYSGSGPGPSRTGSAFQRERRASVGRQGQMPITDVPAKSLIGLPWRYALRCIDELGLILRAEVIWSKPNGLPESVTDRVRRSHEQWFHMTLRPNYYSAVDEIREPAQDRGPALSWQGRRGRGDPSRYGEQRVATDGAGLGVNPLGKLPGSVWTIATEPLSVPDHLGIDHFAAFPTEWPRRIIAGWSPSGICTACGEGRRPVTAIERTDRRPSRHNRYGAGNHGSGAHTLDTVPTATITGEACACPDPAAPTRPSVILDPFGGTGTTSLVARALGRTGISVDMSADYCRLAQWRTTDPGELARAMRVDKPEPVAAGQMSLLDEIGPGPWT